jgi:hypothetical protein
MATCACAASSCTRPMYVVGARLCSRLSVRLAKAALVSPISVVVPDNWPSKLSTSQTDSSDWSDARCALTWSMCGSMRRSGWPAAFWRVGMVRSLA